MGCISSKVITKSMSFHQEMSQSLQRTTNGIPVLEELFTTSPKPTLQHSSTETINTWELISGLRENQVKQEGQQADPSLSQTPVVVDIYKAKWSKSCHWSPENEMLARVPRDDGLTADRFKLASKGVVRTRSFHTIEEYDAMVENIQLIQEQLKGFGDGNDSATKLQLQHSKCSSKKTYCVDYYHSNFLEATQSCPRDEESTRENSMIDVAGTPLTSIPGTKETKEVLPSLNVSTLIIEKSKAYDDDDPHEGNFSGKGFKRKVIAKGLKSLQIPSTIEFPRVPSLRDWVQAGGQVNSSGAYVTPKFGNYNLQSTNWSGKVCGEDSIFSPKLVAAFEECMQQMEVDESIILKQIEQVTEDDCTPDIDMEAEEERSSNNHLNS
ncbi:uncharacterized protein LOC130782784 [Actinidia eriantha]|uniref:uncharacterized protein LOC130782784 n=1 Tax=Actinidia eriantha TaxID=165200 RepID=UPI00258399DD|nr:uncharacterized protein LOC130782784 [Actinidia eriantha]XP_057498174.1 uncharacterized protein LOC130782784 [Actinidia eriantha]XP_057498175.1 uncharacterized protein LOC130782784 [Actinidia eriantha]XP_057498176.1 uncharacterized protein LOC130782784 [Actinidia eriantha]XP_057498177.1 uncharacterized protein LOC130782784 [Actinidia eriantha]XP_057498178.1 uncharacterized protein LOC130782784 [Actinidia eriantha]XP_057498179.1 uncharacterized protein LOC130782784 [Actinidia eriantha]XP_0